MNNLLSERIDDLAVQVDKLQKRLEALEAQTGHTAKIGYDGFEDLYSLPHGGSPPPRRRP